MVIAKLKNLRIAPRKVRLVVDLIRRKNVDQARSLLRFTPKRASLPVLKLLEQAVANAKNNFHLDPLNLFVSKITVDEGAKIKRWMPRARGQAFEIQKKISHITIFLEEIKKGKKLEAKSVPGKAEGRPVSEKEIKKEKPRFKPMVETAKPVAKQEKKRVYRRKAL